MSESDRSKWNKRYGSSRPPLANSAALAVQWAQVLPTAGRALDVATGRGHLAIWLAERGLSVDAIDISSVALEQLRASAEGAQIRTIECDLDDGLPQGCTDYALITVVNFHAPTLMPALCAALAPNGVLLMEVLAQGDHAGNVSKRFLASPGELLQSASELEVLYYNEGVIRGRNRAQLVARRRPS